MLLEIFIVFEILTFVMFCVSFFSKHEIMWAITLVLSGLMVYSSSAVEYAGDVRSYGYLVGVNALLFAAATILLIFDLFDKYGGGRVSIPVNK